MRERLQREIDGVINVKRSKQAKKLGEGTLGESGRGGQIWREVDATQKTGKIFT